MEAGVYEYIGPSETTFDSPRGKVIFQLFERGFYILEPRYSNGPYDSDEWYATSLGTAETHMISPPKKESKLWKQVFT